MNGEPRERFAGRYCVIIPAYEAAETIGAVLEQVKPLGLDAVVVNDGSHDETAAVASRHGAVVISHLRNVGKGHALRTGFAYALRQKYDGVITLDSDGQHDAREIPRLIKAGEVQHAGMVLGNRMEEASAIPPLRRRTNQFMSRIISRMARQHIPDTQCGFRLIRRELLEQVPLTSNHYEIETELLVRAAARRWKIISVPVRAIYDHQHSHIRPVPDGLRFLLALLRLTLRR